MGLGRRPHQKKTIPERVGCPCLLARARAPPSFFQNLGIAFVIFEVGFFNNVRNVTTSYVTVFGPRKLRAAFRVAPSPFSALRHRLRSVQLEDTRS
jgi:hypothetical protein